MEIKTIKTADVKWREDLYPRIKTDAALVQRYADNLEMLPPIEVNQHDILIDGWHRWTAHRKANLEDISVIVTETAKELDIFALAIERNATHGLQLSEQDKKDTANKLYSSGNGYKKERIAHLLSVTPRQVNNYLRDTDQRLREERKRLIFDMWMACYTQEEIAKAAGVTKETISEHLEVCQKMETFPKSDKLSANFQDEDFKPPLYNIWSFAKKTNEVSHYGNSEQRILENLIYLYTEPFDIVVDPFAGGGSTIDVCRSRLRRCWASDRHPIPEREKEIRELDVCQELPPLYKRWAEVSLTYLDPPYWKQAEGKYSKDPEDLANMPLEDFTNNLCRLISSIVSKQSKGVVALLMQPTQWHAPGHQVVDHIFDIISGVASKPMVRISCPYSTEQCTPQMVDWARDNKQILVLSRELIVWRLDG